MLLVRLLLSLLSADSFDARERAEAVFRGTWPLSAPVLLAGRGSDDPEVRFRCQRILVEKSRYWAVVGDVCARPRGLFAMFRPQCLLYKADLEPNALRAAAAIYELCGGYWPERLTGPGGAEYTFVALYQGLKRPRDWVLPLPKPIAR